MTVLGVCWGSYWFGYGLGITSAVAGVCAAAYFVPRAEKRRRSRG